jgi:hypothetical protein
MHEKLENDEVLHRLNRKIDFKKNPRYESQKLPKFADIPGQQVNCIITKATMNTADQK